MLTMTIDLVQDRQNQLLEEARRHRLARVAAGARRPPRWVRRTPATAKARPRRRWALAVALVGLTATALSATALTLALHSDDVGGANTVMLGAASRVAAVSTADLVYEPGHSSGWHVHPGVHSVVVLSGTLTVYDEACGRHDYGPGQAYLGGREPHLARNTGTETVGLAVTYVADPSADTPGSVVSPPMGCEAA